MTATGPISLTVSSDERFARFERVEWWDQKRLRDAKVLVAGAGAIGNEVIKNLALLGIGHLVIADMDTIEVSNLTRSALFRAADAGMPKAERAAAAACELYPDIHAEGIAGNICADLGLGYFRWADVVVGALDNREARLFLNSACARLGKPWLDGGIEVLQGVARGFAPPETACYECTMSEVDWRIVNQRRSCSMLARRALDFGGTPTTPTTASIIGAIEAQEVMKILHGLPALLGRGFVYEGAGHTSYNVTYRIDPDCMRHDPVTSVESIDAGWDTPLSVVWNAAINKLGGCDALELGREIVETLSCVVCGDVRGVLQPIDRISDDDARCVRCGGDAAPQFLHSLSSESGHLKRSARALGLPRWEIVWARRGEQYHGFELAADGGVR